MTIKEIFRIWAPSGKKWVDWVRPVPFAGMKEYSKMYEFSNLEIPVIEYIDHMQRDTAIIVDLPGADSVEEGIALARLGYRPIPIYNGTIEQEGARATVDNQAVGMALEWGADKLSKIDIADDVAPVFLLDSNRLHRYKMDVSIFDNSWDVYPQDLPTAEYLLSNGIKTVMVVDLSSSKDLKKILREYRKKKIKINEVRRFGKV